MNTILSTPRRLVMALVAAGAIGALGATGAGLVGTRSAAQAQVTQSAAAAQPAALNLPVVNAPNFADITARNGAAVVNISTDRLIQDEQRAQGFPKLPLDDPFYEFFKRFGQRRTFDERARLVVKRRRGGAQVMQCGECGLLAGNDFGHEADREHHHQCHCGGERFIARDEQADLADEARFLGCCRKAFLVGCNVFL